jgi:hypothetical protein
VAEVRAEPHIHTWMAPPQWDIDGFMLVTD